jgi:chromatin remodeling complex protein RSC6
MFGYNDLKTSTHKSKQMPRKATASKSSKNVEKKSSKESVPKVSKSNKVPAKAVTKAVAKKSKNVVVKTPADKVVADKVVADKVVADKVVADKVVTVEEPDVSDVENLGETDTPSKKKRRVPTKETVEEGFDEIVTVIDEEIAKLRESSGKAKGVKFLRSLGKRLKTLRGHSLRVMKQKQKTNRKNNTNSGFLKPVQISKEMAKFTGWDHTELKSRVDVTKYICKYIRENDLQNPEDRRQIVADKKLSKLLEYTPDGDDKPLTYYRIQTYMKKHFTNPVNPVKVEE